jgi:hypothetical protein
MNTDSDRPAGLSGMYPRSVEAGELHRALTRQARSQERSLTTLKTHWSEIKRLGDKIERLAETDELERLDKIVHSLSQANLELTKKVVVLEARMAIYAGLGAFAGGTIVALVMKFIVK